MSMFSQSWISLIVPKILEGSKIRSNDGRATIGQAGDLQMAAKR